MVKHGAEEFMTAWHKEEEKEEEEASESERRKKKRHTHNKDESKATNATEERTKRGELLAAAK